MTDTNNAPPIVDPTLDRTYLLMQIGELTVRSAHAQSIIQQLMEERAALQAELAKIKSEIKASAVRERAKS